MVCYMYYTDVFVGSNNIDNLKSALNAELKDSGKPVDLTQLKALASGLEKFIGYSGGKVSGSGIGKKGLYASSYNSNNVTWKELCKDCKCKSVSNPCSSCSCPSGVCSNPSQCCDNCDVRKAAKIFLGMLPCLYYALQYLYDKCEGDWRDQKIIKDSSLTSLGRFFIGMGYDVKTDLKSSVQGSQILKLLNTLINDSKGSLDKIYNVVKEKYFTSSSHSLSTSLVSPSDSPSHPKTVRDILLWLSGLPFIPGFKDLLNHCKGLCSATKDSVNFNDFESSLYSSCLRSPFVLAAIQWPSKSEIFPLDSFINSKSLYPEDPFDLFNMLVEYTRKVFPPLKFLCMQCERSADQGGWKDCAYGQGCAEKFNGDSSTSGSSPVTSALPASPCCSPSGSHGLGILCTTIIGNSNVHEHCTKPGVKCRGLDKDCPDESGSIKAHSNSNGNCKPCPHHLVRFLIDDFSESQSTSKALQNFRTPFKLPEGFPPMGFSKENLPSPGRSGESLHTALKDFCDSGNSSSSLTTLLKFELHVSRTPPETLGEFFVFFKQFKDSSVFKNNFESYVDGEPGFYSADPLKDALQKPWKIFMVPIPDPIPMT